MSLGDATTLPALLDRMVERYDRRPAVSDLASSLSFRELRDEALRWAHALDAAGVGPGVHVGLLAANSPRWMEIAFGVWTCGATLVPISTFATARELEEIVDHADIQFLILQPTLRAHDYRASLATLSLPSLRRTILLADDEVAAFLACESTHLTPPTGATTACILYTSGTTGRPKGVMLSHAAILATTLPTAARSGLSDTDSLLSSLPLFWVAGLVIRALPTLTAGCELILLESFSADAAVTALARFQPTALHLRPPQVGQVLEHAAYEPRLLARVRKGNGRTAWFNGQLPQDALFITGYGMTEMSGYVTAFDWREGTATLATPIGTRLPGVELRIDDGHGRDCAPGTTGEVVVRGPGMFQGYYKEPSTLGRDANNWFGTGDLGFLDDAGVFHFVGRSKELLRVKGINVSPLEVESILAKAPGVEAVYVVGLPEDSLDQRLVALVIARHDALDEAEIRAVAARDLSHYKRPEVYLSVERHEIALGRTSKPQRSQLAALAASKLAQR